MEGMKPGISFQLTFTGEHSPLRTQLMNSKR